MADENKVMENVNVEEKGQAGGKLPKYRMTVNAKAIGYYETKGRQFAKVTFPWAEADVGKNKQGGSFQYGTATILGLNPASVVSADRYDKDTKTWVPQEDGKYKNVLLPNKPGFDNVYLVYTKDGQEMRETMSSKDFLEKFTAQRNAYRESLQKTAAAVKETVDKKDRAMPTVAEADNAIADLSDEMGA
jgi:hypothetical protein